MNSSLPDIGDVATRQIGGLEIRLARGGRSRSRPEVMSPEAMGDFVIELAVHLGVDRMHAVGPDVGTSALLFAAARKPALFESVVAGGGGTSPELAGAGLKELIESSAGAFANAEGGDVGAAFVTQSAAIKTPAAVLEDYRLSSAGRRFEEAAQYDRAYPRDLPRLKALLPSIETPVLVLAGRNDPIVPPPNGQLLADRLPHAVRRYSMGGISSGRMLRRGTPLASLNGSEPSTARFNQRVDTERDQVVKRAVEAPVM